MFPQDDGTYRLTTSNIPAGNYGAKVVKGFNWDTSWGDNGGNVTFSTNEGENVTFIFDPAKKQVSVEVSNPPTTDPTEEPTGEPTDGPTTGPSGEPTDGTTDDQPTTGPSNGGTDQPGDGATGGATAGAANPGDDLANSGANVLAFAGLAVLLLAAGGLALYGRRNRAS